MNADYDSDRGSVRRLQSYLNMEYGGESFPSNQMNYGDHYSQALYEQRMRHAHNTSQYQNEQPLDASGNFGIPSAEFPRAPASNTGFSAQELQSFVTPRDDTPWVGFQSTQNGNSTSSSQMSPSNTVFKRPALPAARRSNNGSQDSGFVSAKGHNGIGSQNDHVSNPTNQLSDGITGPSKARSLNEDADSVGQSTTSQGRKRKPKSEPTKCEFEDCPKVLKNNSEAQKHYLQHIRPFHCTEFNCTRDAGFATENDLQRHRKSVHGVEPLVGKKTGYICQGCPPPGPDSFPKFWPRLDNFKAHVKRKHKEWDQAVLIQVSEGVKPLDAISESGYASQYQSSVPPDGQTYQHDYISPAAPPMSRNGSAQDGMALFGLGDQHNFDSFAGIGEGQHADCDIGNREPVSSFHGTGSSSIGNGATALPNPQRQLLSPVDSTLTSPSVATPILPSFHFSQHGHHGQVSSFGDGQRQSPPLKRQRTDDNRLSHNSMSYDRNEKGEFVCRGCNKTKKRECELRKHMKRHSRPYGCTFANCTKRFGSRNDWKRHENSQHFLQEMWRCELAAPDGTKCGKLAFHVKTFSNHLQRKHGIFLNTPENEAQCRSMHLGREGHHHFWCGFCNCLIEQQDTMEQGAYDVRFKHIGHHFDKESKWIDDWVDIEENRKKGLIAKEGRKKNKGRYRNGVYDDDSDLPDDGIPSFVTGYSAPVSHASMSYDDGMQGGDMDAEAVSDSEWRSAKTVYPGGRRC